MDAHGKLIERVEAEQDDVLCTLQLVEGNPDLEGRLFDQLVDLLVEGMFLDLRKAYVGGSLTREGYVRELSALADHCRRVGLLPLPEPRHLTRHRYFARRASSAASSSRSADGRRSPTDS